MSDSETKLTEEIQLLRTQVELFRRRAEEADLRARMRAATRKVDSLILYTGYAEVQSWSGLLLSHEKGFPSVQEALMNLRELTLSALQESSGSVSDWWENAIHGDPQTSDVWGKIVEESLWTTYTSDFRWENRVEVACAPELISNSNEWDKINAELKGKLSVPIQRTYLTNIEDVKILRDP